MSIKLRLALLLGLLLLVFVFCLVALRTLEQRQFEEALTSARRDDAKLLGNWIDLRAASLRRFADDASVWPQRSPKWGRNTISSTTVRRPSR